MTLPNWQPYKNKVDYSGTKEGRFASGAFTMVAAGPPRLSAVGGALGAASGGGGALWAQPVGLVQGVNLNQNANLAKFWELGSERSYSIRGRVVGQIGLSRVYYHGPSLLRSLYAFYQDLIAPTLIPTFGVDPTLFLRVANQHDVKIPPGYENIYLNLASDLFSQPCGLLIYMKDSNENTLGATYVEEAYIPSHSIATDAQGVVVQEQISLQYERLVPVALPSVALVTSALESEIV